VTVTFTGAPLTTETDASRFRTIALALHEMRGRSGALLLGVTLGSEFELFEFRPGSI
jgi:hypothetical protein